MTEEDIDLKKYIRTVQGFPTSGIDYKDVMPLFADAKAFSKSIDQIAKYYEKEEINYVAGIEARGFLIASALSIQLGAGLSFQWYYLLEVCFVCKNYVSLWL